MCLKNQTVTSFYSQLALNMNKLVQPNHPLECSFAIFLASVLLFHFTHSLHQLVLEYAGCLLLILMIYKGGGSANVAEPLIRFYPFPLTLACFLCVCVRVWGGLIDRYKGEVSVWAYVRSFFTGLYTSCICLDLVFMYVLLCIKAVCVCCEWAPHLLITPLFLLLPLKAETWGWDG